jgi:hypothetical protein
MNGSNPETLLDALTEAYRAVDAAMRALDEAAPNGRDYYPQGPDAVQEATREHQLRAAKLRSVHAELEELVMSVQDQIDEREAARARRRNPSASGVNWLEPDSWPETMSHKQFAHDFRVLLQDHDFDSPSYDILHIRLKDVVIPPLDDEDDRHFDSETGEPSTAYIDGLVEAMRAGVPMPPIVVGNVEAGSEKPWGWPYDGRHRLNAAHRLGLKWVPAIDVTGRGDV